MVRLKTLYRPSRPSSHVPNLGQTCVLNLRKAHAVTHLDLVQNVVIDLKRRDPQLAHPLSRRIRLYDKLQAVCNDGEQSFCKFTMCPPLGPRR